MRDWRRIGGVFLRVLMRWGLFDEKRDIKGEGYKIGVLIIIL